MPPPSQPLYAGPPPAYPSYGGYPPVAPQTTSGQAIAAMVVGIVGIVLYFAGLVLGIVALVLGILALRRIQAAGGAVGGRGMAIAGIVTGSIAIVIGLIVLVALFAVIGALGSGNLDGTGPTPDIGFTSQSDPVHSGGTLTVAYTDPGVPWSDIAFLDTYGDPACAKPAGMVTNGQAIHCSLDEGTVVYVPTNHEIYAWSFAR